MYVDKSPKEWKRKFNTTRIKVVKITIYGLLFADDKIILIKDKSYRFLYPHMYSAHSLHI